MSSFVSLIGSTRNSKIEEKRTVAKTRAYLILQATFLRQTEIRT